jgi:hypothetical protein
MTLEGYKNYFEGIKKDIYQRKWIKIQYLFPFGKLKG